MVSIKTVKLHSGEDSGRTSRLNSIKTSGSHIEDNFCGSAMEDRGKHTCYSCIERSEVSLHNHLELGVCLGGAAVPLTERRFSASKNPISVGSAGVALSSLRCSSGIN